MKYKSMFSTRGKWNSSQRDYYKEGVELIFADQDTPLKLAFLPAYNPKNPDDECGWIPSLDKDGEESDFYTMIRVAKFVGHGANSSRQAFLSPRTFDPEAIDPYEALFRYCWDSEYWKYLVKKKHKNPAGNYEGPVIPKQKDCLVANVIDVVRGERGGVFVTELSEGVAQSLLYERKKDGTIKPGILTVTNGDGKQVYGDITNPSGALVVEIEYNRNTYTAKWPLDDGGEFPRVKIPKSLLPHRHHMENPETFLNHPGTPREIVEKLAAMLRGFHDNPKGIDESAALKEALDSAYGEGVFKIDVPPTRGVVSFGGAKEIVPDMGKLLNKQGFPIPKPQEEEEDSPGEEEQEATEKAEEPIPEKEPAKEKPKDENKKVPMPGEDIDPLDIKKIRDSLLGGTSLGKDN